MRSSEVSIKAPLILRKKDENLKAMFLKAWMKSERGILIALKVSSFCATVVKASRKKICALNRPSTEKSRWLRNNG